MGKTETKINTIYLSSGVSIDDDRNGAAFMTSLQRSRRSDISVSLADQISQFSSDRGSSPLYKECAMESLKSLAKSIEAIPIHASCPYIGATAIISLLLPVG
jgi:hypothetical protein